jgi:small subunit ribosomal protein S17
MDKQDAVKHLWTLEGTVKSVKNQKTAIVSVTTMTRHPLYKKAVKKTKRYAVHNELAGLAVGDMVRIAETKPISKTKHFKVLEKIIK